MSRTQTESARPADAARRTGTNGEDAAAGARAPVSGPGVADSGPVRPRPPSRDQVREAFESGRYPYARKLSRRSYEADKARLQAELLKLQLWAQETGERFVMLFEGRDAAG